MKAAIQLKNNYDASLRACRDLTISEIAELQSLCHRLNVLAGYDRYIVKQEKIKQERVDMAGLANRLLNEYNYDDLLTTSTKRPPQKERRKFANWTEFKKNEELWNMIVESES